MAALKIASLLKFTAIVEFGVYVLKKLLLMRLLYQYQSRDLPPFIVQSSGLVFLLLYNASEKKFMDQFSSGGHSKMNSSTIGGTQQRNKQYERLPNILRSFTTGNGYRPGTDTYRLLSTNRSTTEKDVQHEDYW
jgi:hypothetical protein